MKVEYPSSITGVVSEVYLDQVKTCPFDSEREREVAETSKSLWVDRRRVDISAVRVVCCSRPIYSSQQKIAALTFSVKTCSKNIWSYPQTQAHLAVIALNMLLGFSIGFIRVISLKVSSASTRRWGSPWAMAEVLSGWNLRRAFLYAALTCHSQSVF